MHSSRMRTARSLTVFPGFQPSCGVTKSDQGVVVTRSDQGVVTVVTRSDQWVGDQGVIWGWVGGDQV